jgi:2'-5' RNA ligase
MAPRARTFIAAEISSEVRRCAMAAIEQLASVEAPVKWVDPANMHLTIKFLGDVDYTALSEVCRALDKVVAHWEPFEVECGGVGAFPKPERPRTIWLGVDDPQQRLTELAAAVENALAEHRFRRESRSFHPHLTLGRLRDGRHAAELARLIQTGNFSRRGVMVIDELVVFSSELTSNGPIYTPMGHAEFGAG